MVQFDDKFADSQVKQLRAREEERAVEALAPQIGFPYINLIERSPNPEAISTISEREAREAFVVGFDLNQKTLSVACKHPNHPTTTELIGKLEQKGYAVMVYLASMASLEHAWKRYKDVVGSTAEEKGVLSIGEGDMVNMMTKIKHKSDVATILKSIGDSNNTRRITETLALMFAGALALGASDIHIEPEEAGVRLRYRLDGVLHDIVDLDTYIHKRIMSRLKLLSGMVLNVKVEAQDGRFTFSAGEKQVEVRSSIIPGAIGESIVMRLLDPSVASFSLDTLNVSEHVMRVIKEQIKKPNGLIITTGPTGSGKTTALYAFLREVNDEEIKIITIENPVEYKLEGVMHTQTAEDYTFAQGLRAILRQDPDVIMVGEIRDHEVAETAIHAAQTGHLVFSTLHTNTAIAGFVRLIDLGISPDVLGSSINLILGQRLVRILCPDCKQSRPANPNETTLITEVLKSHPYPPSYSNPFTVYEPVGCPTCNATGYKGRQAVFEAVIMDPAVEEVISRDPRETSIKQAAEPQRIPTMLQDGMDKVLQGVTSIKELERVVEFPANLASFKTRNDNNELQQKNPTPEDEDVDFESHIV
tara:strand:- start:31152 stop:32915 length:1764 start_codon:yes stop_codon:yes gene_type:complete